VRFLADMGVSLTTVEALRGANHDAVHLRDRAQRGSERHHLRLRNQTPAPVNPRLFRVIAECAAELAIVTIVLDEDEGIRVRRLPIRP
jgi:hypothetical protein